MNLEYNNASVCFILQLTIDLISYISEAFLLINF